MSSQRLLKLFDIKTKTGPKPFSPNVWKIRLVLNYKNIPYETKWVAYPNITPALSDAGCPPTRTELPLYTVPAIIDGETKLSDSPIIIEYLEKTYPEPAVHPGQAGPFVGAVMKHVLGNLAFICIPQAVQLFDGEDLEYYVKSRKEIFGVPVEDMYPEPKREAMLQGLEGGLTELAKVIEGTEHANGWVFGTSPTYADFTLVGVLLWLKDAGPPGAWDRVKGLNGGIWEKLYTAAEPYMQIK